MKEAISVTSIGVIEDGWYPHAKENGIQFGEESLTNLILDVISGVGGYYTVDYLEKKL